jgi:hypothetical protein
MLTAEDKQANHGILACGFWIEKPSNAMPGADWDQSKI